MVGEARAQEPATRFAIELEAGATWQSYNDVQIPNDSRGTRLSLRELVGSGPWASGRVYLTWQPGRRHGLRLLLAPFSLTETGVSGTPLAFAGADYAAGRAVQDIVAAIEKIQRHADELRRAEHPLVALKGTNRAERDRKARLAGS